jgi:hypothetical protein
MERPFVEFGDIRAGAKRPVAVAGEHDRAHIVVLFGTAHTIHEIDPHLLGHGVEPLRPMQRDDEQLTIHLRQDILVGRFLVCHFRRFPSIRAAPLVRWTCVHSINLPRGPPLGRPPRRIRNRKGARLASMDYRFDRTA